MKIRIIKEQKIEPVSIQIPFSNPEFNNIQIPATNKVRLTPTPLRFQVFMHRQVYDKIWQHILKDTTLELGGALLGYYAVWHQQKYLMITDVLNQPIEYFASPIMIKFTNQFYTDVADSLEQINVEYASVIRLGLYHSHPNYGVYMSKTDAVDFKRTAALNHQIAMIFDPIRKEDGLYFWLNEHASGENDISPTASYHLYDTTNPAYTPHLIESNNYEFAAANSSVLFKGSMPEKLETSDKVPDNLNIPPPSVHIKGTVSNKTDNNPIEPQLPIIKNQNASSQNSVPMKCPLYDLNYYNEAILLKRYFKSLKITQRHQFPYMIFLPQSIKPQFMERLQNSNNVVALLYGVLGYDSEKESYFVFISHFETESLPPTEQTREQILTHLEKKISNTTSKQGAIVGWIVAGNMPFEMPYLFYDLHKKHCPQNHQLGILLTQETGEEPNFNNAILVAYDHLQNEPYNYYQNLFLYRLNK